MMQILPSKNTSGDLTQNEQICYSCAGNSAQPHFQTFRLYLPTFPSTDIGAIIEIPFRLARIFALGLENYLSNAIEILLTYHRCPEKFAHELRRERSPKFLSISQLGVRSKTRPADVMFHFKKTEYVLNDLKDLVGAVNVEIFENIPATTRRALVENCEALLSLQNAHFLKMIGCIDFVNVNLFVRITEHHRLTLESVQQILSRDKEIIDQGIKMETCVFILAEMVLSLDSLHERGITHRQLSPSTILIDANGHIKIGGIFEAMNGCRDRMLVAESPHSARHKEVELSSYAEYPYLDPEVLRLLLTDAPLEAFAEFDCLSDVFSLAIIIVEILTDANLLDVAMWNVVYKCHSLSLDLSHLVEIFLNPKMQIILRQRLSAMCGFVSKTFYAFILLMLQPKKDRMRGLRLRVQRHRSLHSSGCEYKMRIDLVKRHPAFEGVDMNSLFIRSSPVAHLLAGLNGI